jgi:predicted dehydrogenase
MRFALIGCGAIGAKRARAARACGLAIAVCADPDGARARALADEFGAEVAVDWRAAAAAPGCDAVIVCTTHDALAPAALAALAAGKHVLVEKPAAIDVAQAEAIAAAARGADRVVKVGFNHRFHPAPTKAHAMVRAGEIGPILSIRGRYGHGGRPGMEKEWRCDAARSGGGELIDQGSHLIDLSRWFMGDLRLGYARLPTLFWPTPVEDNCFVSLEAGGGRTAWLHASWNEWKNLFSFEIAGRDGRLGIEGLGGSYGVERLVHHRMLPGMGPPETTSWEYPFPDESWRAEIEDFVAAIRAGTRANGDIEDAVALHRILNDAYAKGSR